MAPRHLQRVFGANTRPPECADLVDSRIANVCYYLIPCELWILTGYRHSLSDINSLLIETKSILAEMSLNHDQATLRGTPSIALSDTSDVEPDLEEKAAGSKSYGQVAETPLKVTQDAIQAEPAQEQNLIDLSEKPSLLDSAIEERLSPALEDLRCLGQIYEPENTLSEASTKPGISPSIEKRDSAQSHEIHATAIVFHERFDRSSPRTSELLTPLSPGHSGESFFQRNPSTSTSYSNTSETSVQSEYPEAVGVDEPPDPFPNLENRPSHIPPTTKEELVSLQDRRQEVVKSDNVNEKLAWAEDTLHFISLARMYRDRISKLQAHPTEVPLAERMLETDAKHFIENEADTGVPLALFLKGMYFGLKTAESTELYMAALLKGHYRSAFYIGMVHERNNAMKQAISYYNQGADGRDSASHYVRFTVTRKLSRLIHS
jgi:hypothetical protein